MEGVVLDLMGAAQTILRRRNASRWNTFPVDPGTLSFYLAQFLK